MGIELGREAHCLGAVTRMPGHLEPVVGHEDGLEGLREQAVIVRDEHADQLGRVDGGLQKSRSPLEM